MNTRYLQLSFRFFIIQATLVTLYYVSQYSFVLYKIAPGSFPGLTGLTNNINTLFRQQTQLFGKVLFLTVYAFSLAFLFLPASFLESPLASALRATYVISEQELRGVVGKRKKMIRDLNNIMLMNNLVIKAKAEVFCVDRALDLRNVAFEVYYSPDGMDTEGAEGVMDLERSGYSLVDCCFLKEKSVFVLIARHKVSRRLIVAFRGSLNYKHFETNIDYGKKDVDILSLSLDKLDAIDELDVERGAVQYERSLHAGFRKPNTLPGMQSWEDGGEEYEEDEDGASFSRQSTSNAFSRQTSFTQPELQASQSSKPGRTMRNTIAGVAGAIGGATVQILDQSAGLVRSAAKYTPVLQGLVKPYIHTGFWEAYSLVREFVHAVVRRELAMEPADLFVTGHSLGGALGTIASLDLAVHTLPRINAYMAKKRALADENVVSSPPQAGSKSRFRRVKICQYNFGSPKVGNGSFVALVNKWVPDSFRVVVDGDVVSSLPPTGYRHAGTEIVVDRAGNGSIIIDRSFVERWLRPATVYSIRVHSLHMYLKGIAGIKKAAEFFTATDVIPPPLALSTLPSSEGLLTPAFFSARIRLESPHSADTSRLDSPISCSSETWRSVGNATPTTTNPIHDLSAGGGDGGGGGGGGAEGGWGESKSSITPSTPRNFSEAETETEAEEDDAEEFENPVEESRSIRGLANKFVALLGIAPYSVDLHKVGDDMAKHDIFQRKKRRGESVSSK